MVLINEHFRALLSRLFGTVMESVFSSCGWKLDLVCLFCCSHTHLYLLFSRGFSASALSRAVGPVAATNQDLSLSHVTSRDGASA